MQFNKDFQEGALWAMQLLRKQLNTRRVSYDKTKLDNDADFGLLLNGLSNILHAVGSEFEHAVMTGLTKSTPCDMVDNLTSTPAWRMLTPIEVDLCLREMTHGGGDWRDRAVWEYQCRTCVNHEVASAAIDAYISVLKEHDLGLATNGGE